MIKKVTYYEFHYRDTPDHVRAALDILFDGEPARGPNFLSRKWDLNSKEYTYINPKEADAINTFVTWARENGFQDDEDFLYIHDW